jgi:hypothetical protein
MDTLIKGQAADISPSLWAKLQHAYPEVAGRYKDGDTLEAVAKRAGHLEVMDFIKQHARLTSSG